MCVRVWVYACEHVLELQVNTQENSNDCACLSPQAEKAVLDVGETLVGTYRSIEVPLVNNSPCPVSFCLSVQQILLGEEPIYDPKTVPSGILFSFVASFVVILYSVSVCIC